MMSLASVRAAFVTIPNPRATIFAPQKAVAVPALYCGDYPNA